MVGRVPHLGNTHLAARAGRETPARCRKVNVWLEQPNRTPTTILRYACSAAAPFLSADEETIRCLPHETWFVKPCTLQLLGNNSRERRQLPLRPRCLLALRERPGPPRGNSVEDTLVKRQLGRFAPVRIDDEDLFVAIARAMERNVLAIG